jgi:hypothetical protein
MRLTPAYRLPLLPFFQIGENALKGCEQAQFIIRLTDVGYSRKDAERLITFYETKGDIDGLMDYVSAKEAIKQSLIKI